MVLHTNKYLLCFKEVHYEKCDEELNSDNIDIQSLASISNQDDEVVEDTKTIDSKYIVTTIFDFL